MRSALLNLGMVWLCFSAPASADQYSEMAAGLRERRYFDYALLYLEQLAEQPRLPEEVRQSIPYEKAVTLQEYSRATRAPEQQLKLLDQALAALEQFVKESPNHARAGDAHSQRAEILLGKARVDIFQSRLPANQGNRAEFQAKARDWIKQARDVFEAAKKQYEESFQSYGTYIDQEKFPDKFKAREQVLNQFVTAQYNVCVCRYEEAQTYDAGSAEFKRLSSQAAEEFEQVYQRYRDYPAGLYSRLYQGKCFDEQGDTQKAMGIYNELLGHDGSNARLRSLQNKTLQFKLDALNRKQPPDAQIVVDLAADWLKANSNDTRTPTGLSIQWQQAVGYEALADQRDADKSDKDRNWRTARTRAQEISRFAGEYRDVSLAMVQRLDGKLGAKDRKLVDFEGAFSRAKEPFQAVQELRKELDAARKQDQPADDIKKLEQDLETEIHSAAELLQTALNFANKKDDPKNVAQARLWLAYVHFWANRNYEAAILGEFVAKTAPPDESTLAIDAEFLAMAAYMKAYIETKGPVETKGPDLALVIKACQTIVSRWPESDRAQDARLKAGQIYSQAKNPVDAAAWFNQVPEADARYAEAQLGAGQAFWTGYLNVARLPPDLRPAGEKLLEWQNASLQHLRTGIAKLASTIPADGIAPVDLLLAKISLAEILNHQGEYAGAIAALTSEPHSVMKTVTVPDEDERPASGIQSRGVASGAYKILLRAYIGAGRLDDAQAAMKTLERIAGGGPAGADITELYVGLGKMLKDDLDRFRNTGETERFQSVRKAFETFLNNIYQRQEGHSLGTLSWIGETYSALGESDAANASAAAAYYKKAAGAFQDIIHQADSKSGFATPEQLLAVKVRLASCLRMQRDYPAAEQLITELLQQRKDDLKLQLESAHLYQDWASEPGAEQKYLLAISGNPKNQTMGFAPLSKRVLASARSGGRPELLDIYLETRYQSAWSRFKYALTKTSSKEKRKELNFAKLEIVALARVTQEISDERRAQFNSLYRDVLAKLKEPVVDLDWASDVVHDAPPETAADVAQTPKHASPKKKPQGPKVEPSNSLLTYVLFGGGALLGLAIVAVMIVRRKPARRPLLKAQEAVSISFDFPDVGPAPSSKAAISAGDFAAAGKPSSAGKTPTATRTAATTKPAAKPKPKLPPTT